MLFSSSAVEEGRKKSKSSMVTHRIENYLASRKCWHGHGRFVQRGQQRNYALLTALA